MIFHRFVQIALRKYSEDPSNRRPAVRMLLRNALRLAVLHLGQSETEALTRNALREGQESAA